MDYRFIDPDNVANEYRRELEQTHARLVAERSAEPDFKKIADFDKQITAVEVRLDLLGRAEVEIERDRVAARQPKTALWGKKKR